MPLEKGSLVLINYTALVKDTNEAIDTTVEEEAKKLNLYDQTRRYGPRLVAVGEGWVISGLEEELMGMDVGQKKEIQIPPERAFGQRDPSLVKLIPLRKFGEKAGDISVGDTVEIDNRVGVVRYVGSGRAQVDFNHRLAGKTILYSVEVVKKLETDQEKVQALMERRFGQEAEKIKFSITESKLEVRIPEELYLMDGLQILKRGFANDIFKFIQSVKEVVFNEVFIKEEKKD
jgi:FKBP-type peptidyl-prolyl cis-trans isomerase 2